MRVSAYVFVYAKCHFVCVYVLCIYYIQIYVYILYTHICVCVCVFARHLYIACSAVCIDLILASLRIAILNSPDLHLKPQAVPRSKHLLSRL